MHAQHCTSCGVELEVGALYCRKCGAATPTAITQGHTLPVAAHVERGAGQEVVAELSETLAPKITVLQRLGAGGMGEVYLARDEELARLVAIKLLLPEFASDPDLRVRFLREAEAASAVAHPHVVAIYSVGTLPRSRASYFVMQYIEGRSLADELKRCGTIPENRARHILGQVASALAAAHDRGLVHRDIKPANIMLATTDDRAVVLDFGIAAAVKPQALRGSGPLTSEGASIGTPTYMSPEQAQAQPVSGASDIYSLGVVGYEMLSGAPPFVADNAYALMAMHIREEPPSLSGVVGALSEETTQLLHRSLAKDPRARPSPADYSRTLLPESVIGFEWPQASLSHCAGALRRVQPLVRLSCFIMIVWWILFAYAPSPTVIGSRAVEWMGNAYSTPSFFWTLLRPVLDGLPTAALVWYALVGSTAMVGLVVLLFTFIRMAGFVGLATRELSLGFPLRLIVGVAEWPDLYLRNLLAGVGAFAGTSVEARQRRLTELAWLGGIPTIALIYALGASLAVLLTGWQINPLNPNLIVGGGALGVLILPPLLLLGAEVVARHHFRVGDGARVQLLRSASLKEREEVSRWTRTVPILAGVTPKSQLLAHPVLVVWLIGLLLALALSRQVGQVLAGIGFTVGSVRTDDDRFFGTDNGLSLLYSQRGTWSTDLARLAGFVGILATDPVTQWGPQTVQAFPPCPNASIYGQNTCELGRVLQTFEDDAFGYGYGDPAQVRGAVRALYSFAPALDSMEASWARSSRVPVDVPAVESIRRSRFADFGYSWDEGELTPSIAFWPAVEAASTGDAGRVVLEMQRLAALGTRSLSDPRPLVVHRGLRALTKVVDFGRRMGTAYELPAVTVWSIDLGRRVAAVKAHLVVGSRVMRHVAADPGSEYLKTVLADSSLPPMIRFAVLPNAIVLGACENWREVQFGLNPARDSILRATRLAIGGETLEGAIVGVYENELRILSDSPGVAFTNLLAAGRPTGGRVTTDPDPWGRSAERFEYCRSWYRRLDGHVLSDMTVDG